MHRATAIGYSAGLLFISLWLLCLGLGSEYYDFFKIIFFNFFGKIILLIISSCFVFYFIDEFRKIFWALGLGLDINKIKITNYLVIICSLTISILILLILL